MKKYLLLLFILFLINPVNAQIKDDQLNTQAILQKTQLSERKDNILAYEILNDTAIYIYKSDQVENAKNIIFGDKTYSNTVKTDNTHYKIYTAPQYFKDSDNFIYNLQRATTTEKIFNDVGIQPAQQNLLNYLLPKKANAGISFATDDSYLSRYENTNWYNVRTGATAYDQGNDRIIAYNWVQYATEYGNQYFNYRTPITFDLSLINPVNIISGTINLYSEEPDETVEHAYSFYQGTQTFPKTLEDYSSFVNNQYTNIIENSNVNSNAFTAWTLNNSGINYLKSGDANFMFMETMYDVGSTTPPNILDIEQGRSFNSSLSTDFESHPYIELTISEQGNCNATSTDILSTSTDISLITAITWTDGAKTYTEYRSNFLLYFYIFCLMIMCAITFSLFKTYHKK